MEPNVIIEDGKFKITVAVKLGELLLHPDWPLGMAARDIKVGEIINYKSYENTSDVIINIEWVKGKSNGKRIKHPKI
jgi:hypothetical protein